MVTDWAKREGAARRRKRNRWRFRIRIAVLLSLLGCDWQGRKDSDWEQKRRSYGEKQTSRALASLSLIRTAVECKRQVGCGTPAGVFRAGRWRYAAVAEVQREISGGVNG